MFLLYSKGIIYKMTAMRSYTKQSELEDLFASQLDLCKTEMKIIINSDVDVKREFKFCPTRRFRSDFYLSANNLSLCIEIEGGIWTNGRHVRPSGYIKDMEKYNICSAMGYTLFRFSGKDVKSGKAINFLLEHLEHISSRFFQ